MKIIQDLSFNQNTYIVEMDEKKIIIDPGWNLAKIVEFFNDDEPDLILLTHYHFDHVEAVNALCEKYNIKAYIHKDDFRILFDNNLAAKMGFIETKVKKEHVLSFDAKIDILPSLKIVHAPGHSQGSVLFEYKDSLFTGDVLFADSYGRTDLEGSDSVKQIATLNTFKEMSGELNIFPGHGKSALLKDIISKTDFLN